MELMEIFLIFLLLLKMTSSLKCYQCRSFYDPDYSEKDRGDCENFIKATDKRKFEVDCEYSTMCFKRQTTLEVRNQELTIINRGCAPQIMNGDQVLDQHKWKYVTRVYEPYEEKCSSREEYGRPTNTINCYCRGELCNNTNSLNASWFIIGISLFYIYLILI